MGKDAEPVGSTSLEASLFGCMADMSSCGEWITCYPCMYARTCNALNGNANSMSCCWFPIAFCVLWYPLLYNVGACGLRTKLQNTYNLDNTGFITNLLIAFCCAPCSNCQVWRELGSRKMGPGGMCCAKSMQ